MKVKVAEQLILCRSHRQNGSIKNVKRVVPEPRNVVQVEFGIKSSLTYVRLTLVMVSVRNIKTTQHYLEK